MITTSYYVIEHKLTGKLMPQMRRDKGYTHWNPGINSCPDSALDTPRLIMSKESAKRIITQWYVHPNMTIYYYEDGNGGDMNYHATPDGRKKEDLRILRVQLVRYNEQ